MSILRISRGAGVVLLVLFSIGLALWIGKRLAESQNMRADWLSRGRFAQIREALLAYHAEYGNFPPTKYRAGSKRPIHSWRVLLLPYIDADAKNVYAHYDFSDDWNSPQNLATSNAVGHWAHLFSMDRNDIANYLAIGDEDYWPSANPLRSCMVVAGKDRFLLVEYPDSDVRWMEPKY